MAALFARRYTTRGPVANASSRAPDHPPHLFDVQERVRAHALRGGRLGLPDPHVSLEPAVVGDEPRQGPALRRVAHRRPLVRRAAQHDGLAKRRRRGEGVDDRLASRRVRRRRMPVDLRRGAGDGDEGPERGGRAGRDGIIQVAIQQRRPRLGHRSVRAAQQRLEIGRRRPPIAARLLRIIERRVGGGVFR